MKRLDLTHIKWNNISLTSPGTVPKYIDKEKFYKLSAYNNMVGFYGNEPIYEDLAYRIGKEIGINVVKIETFMAYVNYDNKYFNTYVTISPNFSCNKQYTPIEKYCYINNIKPEDLFNTKFSNEISNIIIFDFIINNKDRHGRNIELNSNEIAPVFDNSFSFCSKIEDSQLNENLFKEYAANNYIGYPNLLKNLDLICSKPKLNLDLNNINKIIDDWSETFNISNIRTEFIKNLIKYRVEIVNKKFSNNSLFSWR